MTTTLVATPDPEPDGSKIGGLPKGLTRVQELISEVCDQVKDMLIEKNRKYGNSALDPCRIYSKADPVEQLNVRIDDKLNRKLNAQDDEDEDIDLDLIGYLVLKKVALRSLDGDL